MALQKDELYLPDGWVNIPFILSRDSAKFILVIGARGTGKTFGALSTMLELDRNFILVRRTAKELETIKDADFNPYNAINNEYGTTIRIWPKTRDSVLIAETEYKETKKGEGKAVPGETFGAGVALSTFATTRSFSAPYCKHIIYDEFIPEEHVRQIRGEAAAFFNLYESINRNRELKGEAPVKALCMANSNQIANPFFIELGIVQKVADMQKRKQHYAYFPDKKVAVYDLSDSPVSKKKKDTFLYNLTKGTGFYEMAVENKYEDMVTTSVKPQQLSQYKPLVRVGELTVYKRKSTGTNERPYYVSPHTAGTPPVFGADNKELMRFRKMCPYFKIYEVTAQIYYENEVSQVLFNKYIDLQLD